MKKKEEGIYTTHTGLYKLYNTNIHERIEMAKKEKQAVAEKH